MSIDRRDGQRLKLSKPLLATMEGYGALVLDIAMSGALVEHYGTVTCGQGMKLTLPWEGTSIEIRCQVARSGVIRTASDGSAVCHTGLQFVALTTEAEKKLQEMIFSFVQSLLAAQRANARATSEHAGNILLNVGSAHRARSRGYASYRFEGGIWTSRITDSPAQPAEGFTVPAYEDEEELARLCEAYGSAGQEQRVMIRLLAELSTRSARLAG
jgi:hypothetical protein